MLGVGWYLWIFFGAILILGSRMFNAQSSAFYQVFYYVGIAFVVIALLEILWKYLRRPKAPKRTKSLKDRHQTSPEIIHCHSCGTKNHSVSSFCHKCGTRLKGIHPQEHFSSKP